MKDNPVIGNNLIEAQKSVEEARELSLQSRARGGIPFGGNLLLYMAYAGELISPWWSRQRDMELDTFGKSSDHISGATNLLISKIVSIPVRVLPRDASITAHVGQADEYTVRLVEESDFGAGWVETISKWLSDFWWSDNGGFLEIIGESGKPGQKARGMSARDRRESGLVAGPIVGLPVGIANLDSLRCQRTGDPEYPLVYMDTNGSRYKYHATRVAFAADMPSPRAEMYGIGFCALGRAINNAQNLVDIGVYKQEKLGSRPKRAIIIAKQMSGNVILGAFADADEMMDNKGLRRFSMIPVIADLTSDASLEVIELAGLPDGFDEETSTRLGMFTIALAWGAPIRWIWPAAVSGATKADAEFQHTSGLSGGLARTIRTLEYLLGGSEYGPYHSKGKFLPPHLRLVLDMQDDWEDQQKAEVKKKRADRRKVDLDDKVITLRVAREQALAEGDLTRVQFDELELEEGRLPDGNDVLSLFASPDDFTMNLLDLGFEEPLAVGVNDPFEMLVEIDAAAAAAQAAASTAGSGMEKRKARQAIAALDALKKLYSPLVAQEVQQEVQAEQQEGAKGFDWGVPVGEVIRGELARGAEGRFVNVEQLKEQIRKGIVQRLAARREGGGKPSKAELKKQENRAKVAEGVGVDAAILNDLLKMRAGGAADEDALIEARLARRMEDGTIVMSPAGRMLLGAANSGDMDRAKEALAKAKEETPEERRIRKEQERVVKQQQREAERQARQQQRETEREARAREREEAEKRELDDNRAKVAKAIPDVNMNALRGFSEGAELDAKDASDMASRGLVELDAEGNARLTTHGKAVLKAADKGEVRDAKDALSKGKDAVKKKLKDASKKRDRAEKEISEAERYDTEAAAAESEAERLSEILAGITDIKKAAEISERLKRAQERADWLREKAAERRERAEALSQEADEAEASVGWAGEKDLVGKAIGTLKSLLGMKAEGRWVTIRGKPVFIQPRGGRRRGVSLGSKVEYNPDPDVVKNAEQYSDQNISHIADWRGVSKEDVEAEIEKRLEEDLAQPIAIRRGIRGALGIAKEGKFKTQFEAGTSGGIFNPDERREIEGNGLGAPTSLSNSARPVYGYFATAGHTAHHYGAVEFVLNDSVKDRATYTLGDSYYHFGTRRLVGGKTAKDKAAWDGEILRYYEASRPGIGTPYIEAQIQGGVTLKDVSKVIIHAHPRIVRENYGEVISTLKAKGIEVEIDEATP